VTALEDKILAALADAVVVADAQGLITGWHGGAQRLFGYAAEEVFGRPITFLFPDAPERDLDELGTLGGATAAYVVLPIRRRRGAGWTGYCLPEVKGRTARCFHAGDGACSAPEHPSP
jgi:PAS domain-containing protein